jgi:hypothetical protein
MRVDGKTVLGMAMAALLAAAVASEIAVAAEPGLTATFVDKTKDSADRTAAVAVEVSGVSLVDPATTDGQPKPGQAHIHYQLDDGPVIATITPKLTFHHMKAGPHRMVVMLAGNDHKQVGAEKSLSLDLR